MVKDLTYKPIAVSKNALRNLDSRPDQRGLLGVPTHTGTRNQLPTVRIVERDRETETERETERERGSFAERPRADSKTVLKIPFSSAKNAWNSVAFIQHKDFQLSFD